MVNLVNVPGNPKVSRCTDCNSFVSRAREDEHTEAQCASRRANKGVRRAKTGGARKKVRITDKKRDQLDKLLGLAFGPNEKKKTTWRKRIYGY